MNLREYQKEDAETIISWFQNEREFRLWGAENYVNYPATPFQMNEFYREYQQKAKFYPLVLEEQGKVLGHVTVRYLDEQNRSVRIGFVVVDNTERGKGYGKQLIQKTIGYAKEQLGAKEISIRVFTNNERALKCYQSAGFQLVDVEKNSYQFYDESWDRAEMKFEDK